MDARKGRGKGRDFKKYNESDLWKNFGKKPIKKDKKEKEQK